RSCWRSIVGSDCSRYKFSNTFYDWRDFIFIANSSGDLVSQGEKIRGCYSFLILSQSIYLIQHNENHNKQARRKIMPSLFLKGLVIKESFISCFLNFHVFIKTHCLDVFDEFAPVRELLITNDK